MDLEDNERLKNLIKEASKQGKIIRVRHLWDIQGLFQNANFDINNYKSVGPNGQLISAEEANYIQNKCYKNVLKKRQNDKKNENISENDEGSDKVLSETDLKEKMSKIYDLIDKWANDVHLAYNAMYQTMEVDV